MQLALRTLRPALAPWGGAVGPLALAAARVAAAPATTSSQPEQASTSASCAYLASRLTWRSAAALCRGFASSAASQQPDGRPRQERGEASDRAQPGLASSPSHKSGSAPASGPAQPSKRRPAAAAAWPASATAAGHEQSEATSAAPAPKPDPSTLPNNSGKWHLAPSLLELRHRITPHDFEHKLRHSGKMLDDSRRWG
jgi:hypothetical protein